MAGVPGAGVRTFRLARLLALVLAALIAYASLYPLSGWRDLGLSPWMFLSAGWPRYWTAFDLVANVLVYVPLGLLITLGLQDILGYRTRVTFGVLLCGTLTLLLEAAQGYLPARVPSHLDVIANSLGGAVGVLLAELAGARLFALVSAYEHRVLAPVPHAEIGITLIGLWLLAQISPETLLFGSGDLRLMLDLTEPTAFSAATASRAETWGVALSTLAVGLFARQLVSERVHPLPPILGFFAVALAIKCLASAVLVNPENALEWLTPGVAGGLIWGIAGLLGALLLPAPLRPAVASLALLGATLLVNLAPFSPYRLAALNAWQQGHFLNFNGLTRWVSSLWPFLALPYLTWLAHRIRR